MDHLNNAVKRAENQANLEVRQAYLQIMGQSKKHGLTGYGDGCRCNICRFSKKLNGYKAGAA